MVFRHLIQQRDVREAIDGLVQKAATEPDVEVGHPNRRLRHLDVLLWMHAPRPRRDGDRSGAPLTGSESHPSAVGQPVSNRSRDAAW